MKTRSLKLLVQSLCTVAAPALLIFASAGCKKAAPPPPPPPKPADVTVEIHVFSMPRAVAVETVLGQPTGTDFANVLKAVQALAAEKKATLVATPTLTTGSGQRAVIESISEQIYPTEFEPPQIPQSVSQETVAPQTVTTTKKVTKTTTVTEQISAIVPITPTTPTAFATRNTGLTLECEPVVSEDRKAISINLVPQTVALHRTIKYKTANGGEIEQPEFYTKKITTSVTVKNGGVTFLGTLEPDKLLSKDVDLTEVVFLRATIR